MKIGSLFTGVGGFDLGAERAGCQIAWQVENNKHCRSVLKKHWPDVALYKDVHDVGRTVLSGVDLICGGFPCQDLSQAGKREGLAGKRSGLWWEFHRSLGELLPTWCLIENVPGLLSSSDGRDMLTLVNSLEELGYGWSYRILNSQYFGVPQRRRRVFIVGRLGGACPPEIFLEPESMSGDFEKNQSEKKEDTRDTEKSTGAEDTITLAFTAESVHHDGVLSKGTHHPLRVSGIPAVAAYRKITKASHGDDYESWDKAEQSATLQGRRDGSGMIVTNTDDASSSETIYGFDPGQSSNPKTTDQMTHDATPPLPAGHGAAGRISIGGDMIPRKLTPRECERLQGFPDDWTRYADDGSELKNSPRYSMMGNAVTVPVAEWLFRRVMT